MRVLAAVCSIAATLALHGCSPSTPDRSPVGRAQSAIAYGTTDSTHTAVVAVLAPVGSTELEECGGSIVQVKGGRGYVLTAAHCCNVYVPTIVVVSNDYSVGEPYLSGGTPVPPVYAVVAGSVYYDAQYTPSAPFPDHDFCMLKFSGATGNTPVLALPSSSGDGLALGSTVEHVGFGITETNNGNSTRRTGSDVVNLALTPSLVEFSQGGASHVPGTCNGDSGGPSLFPAGAPQSQQVVVAVQSFGSAGSTCAQETFGGASRVSSEIGTGGFITAFLADAPTGVQSGSPTVTPPVPAAGVWAIAALVIGLLAVGTGRLGMRRATIRAS
jgi:hypothetical protein